MRTRIKVKDMSTIERETLDEIIKRIDENVADAKTQLQEVKHQTTITNGTVKDINLWRARINGQIFVISVIVTGIVIPLAFKYLSISLFD